MRSRIAQFMGSTAYQAAAAYRTPDSSASRGFTFVMDMALAVPPNTKITGLDIWEWAASSISMCLMRRDSTNTFTCVKKWTWTSSGTNAWQRNTITEYIVPGSGEFYLGIGNSNSPVIYSSANSRAIAYRSGIPSEGQQHTDYTISNSNVSGGPVTGFYGQKPVGS